MWKLLEIIEFNKVAEYKIYIQVSYISIYQQKTNKTGDYIEQIFCNNIKEYQISQNKSNKKTAGPLQMKLQKLIRRY